MAFNSSLYLFKTTAARGWGGTAESGVSTRDITEGLYNFSEPWKFKLHMEGGLYLDLAQFFYKIYFRS